MKAIEAAMKAMFETPYTDRDDVFLIGLDAFLDGILADREALERIKSEMWSHQSTQEKPLAYWAIEALKQEAER